MKRAEIYRTATKTPERGHKPSSYLVVSRTFVAENEDISTVICAPVYSRVLGIRSEVVIGESEGLAKPSAVRCDFLTLMFKRKLTRYIGSLSPLKEEELDHALRYALNL